MKRKKLVAGNWKMNMLSSDARRFLEEAVPNLADEAVVCVPFTVLSQMSERIRALSTGKPKLAVGAQTMSEKDFGAYTGEIAAEMLIDVGAEYVILGHSERRMYFHETDEAVNAKTLAALAKGLIPIVCCGEAENQPNPEAFVGGQIRRVVEGISKSDSSKLIIAYEPIWAIGTGKTATPETAQKMISHIRTELREVFGEQAEEIRILYGGSVKASNIRDFLAQEDIDGALVGGASMDAASFVAMVEEACR